MLGSIYMAMMAETWQTFQLFYGVFLSFGIGLIYWPPVICAWEWFPNNKGRVSGLVLGAFGFGAFIFNFITTGLVNPDNLKPLDDEYFPVEVAERVPKMFRVCLFIWSALTAISILTVTRDPKFSKKAASSSKQVENGEFQAGEPAAEELTGLGFFEALKTVRLWHMFTMLLFGTFFGLYVASEYKVVAQDSLSDYALSIAGAIGSVCNGSGRVVWGSL